MRDNMGVIEKIKDVSLATQLTLSFYILYVFLLGFSYNYYSYMGAEKIYFIFIIIALVLVYLAIIMTVASEKYVENVKR